MHCNCVVGVDGAQEPSAAGCAAHGPHVQLVQPPGSSSLNAFHRFAEFAPPFALACWVILMASAVQVGAARANPPYFT